MRREARFLQLYAAERLGEMWMPQWYSKRRDTVTEAALVPVAVASELAFYGMVLWDGYWFCVGLFAGSAMRTGIRSALIQSVPPDSIGRPADFWDGRSRTGWQQACCALERHGDRRPRVE